LPKGEADILEQAQHLVVRGVVGDEEANIRIAQHGSDSDETSSSARHNADILPRVLTVFALAVVVVVEVRNGFSQRLDSCRRPIFAAAHRDWDGSWSREGPFDLIVDFGRALTEIGPLVGSVEEAMFSSLLGTPVLLSIACIRRGRALLPDHPGTRTVRVESGMGFVSCVCAELDVRRRRLFCYARTSDTPYFEGSF
jgi:hypothetical protein